MPKNRWDGIVYLHGLLPENLSVSALDNLVVGSGDFGLAYLKERWAARFVSELFRKYTVCFVGYSLNDPALRYMMDALAADQLLGESNITAYAFGSYSKGEDEKELNEWRSKNVTPILYREYQHHAYLHRTLREWASTYRDGISGKENIIVRHASMLPMHSTKQDDYVGRILWALSDRTGLPAKHFAELDPIPPLDWLESLSQLRFKHEDLERYGVSPNLQEDKKLLFSLIERPAPYSLAPPMTLVQRVRMDSKWDGVMENLARWLARQLKEPKLILWIARQGGCLNERFANEISRALETQSVSQPILTLWRLILAQRLQRPYGLFDLHDWFKSFKREGLSVPLKMQLFEMLTPRVHLREPFRGFEAGQTGGSDSSPTLKQIVDWEIVLSVDHVNASLEDISKDPKWKEILPDLLPAFTSLLRDTMDLMRQIGGADDRSDHSYIHKPSISDHPQNRDYYDWTSLIDLVRDAWMATAERFPKQAMLEVERWRSIPYPLFRRLAFFAATDTRLFTPDQALELLLVDNHWWLWSVETQREIIRLLVATAKRLDTNGLSTLERAILHGPPREMFREDLEPEELQRVLDEEIWFRLAKCKHYGAKLSPEAADNLSTYNRKYPEWHVTDEEIDEFPFRIGGGGDFRKFIAAPKQRREIVSWLRENPKSTHWQADDWRERCRQDFPTTACALLDLARASEWPAERWREALQAWADEKLINPTTLLKQILA
jgi:hypothetical protein